jgi:hypothetical protein
MNARMILFSPLRIIDGLIDRIFAVSFAVIFAQMPQFIAQYLQRLGGHLDELSRIISQYRDGAKLSGKTLEQFIATHLNSGIPDFMGTGRMMEANLSRYDTLSQSLEAIRTASATVKPFVFIKNADFPIVKGTFLNFTPGVPVTIEGAVYAFCGLITGIIIYSAIKWVIRTALSKNGGVGDID